MNTLRKHLDHHLNKRDEQKFVYSRLCLFDEEYSLDRNRYIWESYLDIESQRQTQVWPVSKYSLSNIFLSFLILRMKCIEWPKPIGMIYVKTTS